MKTIHNKKKLLVTPMNILENTKRWRRTYKGLTTNLYAKIQERSKRNDRYNDEFTLGEFKGWIAQTSINRLYEQWAKRGFKTDRRPSMDRINPLKGYTFDNMQVITAKENRIKGDKEKMALWGKRVYQSTLDGEVFAIYSSIKEAGLKTKINRNNISSVCNGKRKQAGGYGWDFQVRPY